MSAACPNCGRRMLRVINSRYGEVGIRQRRHKCISCDHRFSTAEIILETEDSIRDHSVALIQALPDDVFMRELERRLLRRPIRNPTMRKAP
jgi:transcriptional regulator NrdR family protein